MKARASMVTVAVGQDQRGVTDVWTPALVKEALKQAFKAIKATKMTSRDFPASVRSTMPEVVRADWGDYADPDKDAPARCRANPRWLDRSAEVLAWLQWLDERDRRVVAGRLGTKATWRRLQAMDGRSEKWLAQAVLPRALSMIAQRLETEGLAVFDLLRREN